MNMDESVPVVIKAAYEIKRTYSWIDIEDVYQQAFLIYLSCCQNDPYPLALLKIRCRWIDYARAHHLITRRDRPSRVRMTLQSDFDFVKDEHNYNVNRRADCVMRAYKAVLEGCSNRKAEIIRYVFEKDHKQKECSAHFRVSEAYVSRCLKDFKQKVREQFDHLEGGCIGV